MEYGLLIKIDKEKKKIFFSFLETTSFRHSISIVLVHFIRRPEPRNPVAGSSLSCYIFPEQCLGPLSVCRQTQEIVYLVGVIAATFL